MNIIERLKRSIALRGDDVFVRADFAKLGSDEQVGRAIKTLQADGRIVRLGKGVYARAKPSALSGKPIPVRPVEELAPAALKKLGVQVRPSLAAQRYNAQATTQIPAGVVLNTGRKRISRKISFGNVTVRYENDFSRTR
ncbi:DUF6088 family protein [Nevskia ramosa]|uniref:DUF6088 family protein n=1 Tax=Nevskia ramosa TaxID=64002 RepID=UPI0003B75A25|nr:DUF6088 family protein [Nevskia ramosa]